MQGGWPLTMILTPAGKPIFGGTYFPPDDKKVGDDTIPGMKSILSTVIDLNKKEHDELMKQADKVAEMTADALNRHSQAIALLKLERNLVDDAANAYDLDPEYGGTGNKAAKFKGTKFPRPPVWSFLLSQAGKPEKQELAKSVKLTLFNLAAGGIYDHVGGGFHRYSTERTWTVPHFEKMLYDNAQLVELYSNAYRWNPDPLYKRVAYETLDFVDGEMTNPEGAFYSALDADSNHQEGEFYVWTVEQIKTVLGDENAALFLSVYGSPMPNFEGKFTILRLAKPLAETAREQKTTEEQLLARLEPLKKKLFAARSKRERPFLDTKVICAWNGQMIAGAARAGQVFKDRQYIVMAEKAADFLLSHLRGEGGRLYRLWGAAPGEKPAAKGVAFIDDYAYAIHGLLNLHDATRDDKWLKEAKSLADLAMTWYGDASRGGFYFTPNDGEKLFARSKDMYDSVQPSGNSAMARNLVRLWQKTKDDKYRDQCVKTIKVFSLAFRTSSTSVPTLAQALDELLDASGGNPLVATPSPKPGTEEPKKPRESADVVKASLKLGDATAKGERPFTLTLTIAPDWHIYANPVGNDDLAPNATEVTATSGKEKLALTATYPKGKESGDPKIGKFAIYEGTVAITGTIPTGKDDVEFHVKVNACWEKDGKMAVCLLQSVLKVKPTSP